MQPGVNLIDFYIVSGSKNNSYTCKSYPEDHDSIPFLISVYHKGEISPITAKPVGQTGKVHKTHEVIGWQGEVQSCSKRILTSFL